MSKSSKLPTVQGFTIVELLVVIVVIAILASISIVVYGGIQDRAKRTALQVSLNQVEKGLTLLGTESDNMLSDSGGVCLGREGDYPATDQMPAGSCVRADDGPYFMPTSASGARYERFHHDGTFPSLDTSQVVGEEGYGNIRIRGIVYVAARVGGTDAIGHTVGFLLYPEPRTGGCVDDDMSAGSWWGTTNGSVDFWSSIPGTCIRVVNPIEYDHDELPITY